VPKNYFCAFEFKRPVEDVKIWQVNVIRYYSILKTEQLWVSVHFKDFDIIYNDTELRDASFIKAPVNGVQNYTSTATITLLNEATGVSVYMTNLNSVN